MYSRIDIEATVIPRYYRGGGFERSKLQRTLQVQNKRAAGIGKKGGKEGKAKGERSGEDALFSIPHSIKEQGAQRALCTTPVGGERQRKKKGFERTYLWRPKKQGFKEMAVRIELENRHPEAQ